ncbi:TPA: conjugal transfer protein TraF [Cronobacter sakazakii]|nr:conjugal transfer protein TraF [Cronobacter sakazakii]HAU5494369.1 conjugal transfer protein TraF [Cronobacter sakazakii]HAV6914078.1 conjugal transfer protein TraF [Cronobacter sakazakii]
MFNKTLGLCLCTLAFNALSSVTTETVTKTPKHGLFWYETPKKEEEKKAEEKYPRPVVPSAEVLFKMHPKDVQDLLDRTRDYAVYKLSPDAVLDYYKVQDASRRKAAAFTSLTGYVMLENPALNAAQDYPITNPGNAEKKRELQQSKTNNLIKNRNDYALLFFTEPNCGLCVQQSRILENFQRETSWYIKQIDITKNLAAKKKFNIDRTPVTVLIKKNSDTNKWMPVSVGVDSLDNLRTSIYNMTRVLNGELDPRQFFTNEKQQGGFFDPLKGTKP